MEINYKNDIPIEFGVLAINPIGEQDPFWDYVLLEQEGWNKIYLRLTDAFQILGGDTFRFAIRGIIPFDPESNDFTLDNAEVLLDNIKVIHF